MPGSLAGWPCPGSRRPPRPGGRPLGAPWLVGDTLRLIACRLHIGPIPGDYRTMRRRPAPPPSAQQMIRDYLGRVSVAATKVLPKGDRLLFVGRTRAAIEARVGPLASADADEVMSALTTLGDPEDLAKRERERLYSARRRGAAAAPPALWKPAKAPRRGAAAPPPPEGRSTVPGQVRRPRPWPHRGLSGPDEPKPGRPAGPGQPARPPWCRARRSRPRRRRLRWGSPRPRGPHGRGPRQNHPR